MKVKKTDESFAIGATEKKAYDIYVSSDLRRRDRKERGRDEFVRIRGYSATELSRSRNFSSLARLELRKPLRLVTTTSVVTNSFKIVHGEQFL